jgi:SAM-dependent methyltransferase
LSERAFSEHIGLEFTGERVVPGLVDADLLNEHLARYRFAARFAEGAVVLDAGCGTGYGAAELSRALKVVGVDASGEAVNHARCNFSRGGVHFLRAVCESLPFADGSFDLVVAFEVIEHLERWQDFLNEARRVLRPAGLLLVSTPNKAYYAEARGAAGANPYHVREFEFGEFESALSAVFPHVKIWTQNHSDVIVFNRAERSPGDFDAPGDDRPEQAHFFFAACSRSPIRDMRAFAWSPVSGNVLRDRERHIGLLESELAKKDEWLKQAQTAHAALQESHEQVLAELERSNEWAGRLNAELKQAGSAIAGIQQELATTQTGYADKVRQLEAELVVRLDWVHKLEGRVEGLERELIERTQWAQSLQAELAQSEAQLRLAADSKWVRLGRRLNVGPEIVTGSGQPE